ncbi:MAG: hypothetical protein RR398_07365 [Clostridia bacterium]
MNSSKVFLRIVSVLYIIVSLLGILVAAVLILNIDFGEGFKQLLEPLGATAVKFHHELYFIAAVSVLGLIAGIFGVIAKPVTLCRIFGIVLFAAAIAQIVLTILGGAAFMQLPVRTWIALCISALYLIGTFVVKTESKNTTLKA